MSSPKKTPKKPRQDLTALEQAVMQVIWRLGECSSAEVIAEFRKERTLADTTVRTVITHLRDKGYVALVPSLGRHYRFRPAVAKETFARRMLEQYVMRLFEGSPRQAIAHLLEDANLDNTELEEIRRLIDARKEKGEES